MTTYTVAKKISADSSGRTIYPETASVTVEREIAGRLGTANTGKQYVELPIAAAAQIQDGEYVMVNHGGEKSLAAVYARDGHAEAAIVAGQILALVNGRGKEFSGRVRLYITQQCVVAQ